MALTHTHFPNCTCPAACAQRRRRLRLPNCSRTAAFYARTPPVSSTIRLLCLCRTLLPFRQRGIEYAR